MKPPKPTYQKYTPPKKVYKNWKFTPLPKSEEERTMKNKMNIPNVMNDVDYETK